MTQVLIAPDKFKGTLDAGEVASAIERGLRAARPETRTELVPMADGGEGTLEVVLAATGGNRRQVHASNPLGDPLNVTVGLIDQASTAVVEMAKVSGYSLISAQQRNPLKTSTFGLGQALRQIIEADVEKIILTLGGSATVDGGVGMMQALGLGLIDRAGRRIERPAGGADLTEIGQLVWENPPVNFEHIQFTIACDVLNPACGPNGAAEVFGPQKGADANAVRLLSRGLSNWADLLQRACGRDLRQEPGTGAAGGVAMPLLAFCNASIVPGIDLVCETVSFADKLSDADLVITGEGCLDRQSMMGKVVGTVAQMARSAEIPCVAIVGTTGAGAEECLNLLDRYFTLDGPLEQTQELLESTAARVARELV